MKQPPGHLNQVLKGISKIYNVEGYKTRMLMQSDLQTKSTIKTNRFKEQFLFSFPQTIQRCHIVKTVLELLELFLGSSCLGDLQDVEPHRLAEGSAFSHCNDVTYGHVPEAWGEVDRHVLMSLLKTVVLADVMQVVPSDDDGPLHLHLGHHTRKNPASDGHVSSEGAFLINVSTGNSLSGCFEAQANVSVITWELLFATSFNSKNPLLVLEDGGLLLISPLVLKHHKHRVSHIPDKLMHVLESYRIHNSD